jgi:hypothetical protein
MKKSIVLFLNLLFIVLFLSACLPAERTEPNSSTANIETNFSLAQTTTSLLRSQTVTKAADLINPLTGLTVTNPNLLNRRPVMVKVSNYPAIGRPHAGLAFADIVFDYYIGSGQNRFLALFYGQDAESIGPVRSGRLVDIQLTNLYQGLLGFGSADGDTLDAIYQKLGRRAIINAEAPCPAFCGTDTHSVIGVFANSAEISRWYSQRADDNHAFNLSGMSFGNLEESMTQPAQLVTIQFNYYNRTDWRYDPASNQYLRWMNEEMQPDSFNIIPSTERTTGRQLSFSNLIILFAEYTEFAPSKHDVDIIGNNQGQRAVFFRDGKKIEGTWKVASHLRPIQFFGPTGKPMPLSPGSSWIVLAGMASSLSETKTGEWQMFFALP